MNAATRRVGHWELQGRRELLAEVLHVPHHRLQHAVVLQEKGLHGTVVVASEQVTDRDLDAILLTEDELT